MKIVIQAGHFAELSAEQLLHAAAAVGSYFVDAGSSTPSLSMRKNIEHLVGNVETVRE